MAEIKWEDGGSLNADILLGADLLYDPGGCLRLLNPIFCYRYKLLLLGQELLIVG